LNCETGIFLAIIIRPHRSRPTTHVKMRPIVTDRV